MQQKKIKKLKNELIHISDELDRVNKDNSCIEAKLQKYQDIDDKIGANFRSAQEGIDIMRDKENQT